jgi:outer membrane protein TolC
MFKRIKKGFSAVLHLFWASLILMGFTPVPSYGKEINSSQVRKVSLKHKLTLDQVINLALTANRTIRSSAFGVESQKYAVVSAESEFEWKYAPSTTATASKDLNRFGAGLTLQKKARFGPTISVTPEIIHDDKIEAGTSMKGQVDVGLTIPLLRGWGREANLNSVDFAEYSLRSTQRSHYLAKVNIVLNTVMAVYTIIEQQELLKYNQLQTQSFKNHAVMAAAKEKIGLATPMDVYRAKIRLKDVQDRLNRTQEALQAAQDHLKLILSLPLDESLFVTTKMTYRPLKLTIEKALDTAFENRIELDQAADEIENLERSLRVARHHIKPHLDLVGRYNHLGLEEPFESGLDTNESYWSISLVSTTDWRRTSEKADYRRSVMAVKAAELNRRTLMDTIRREVRQRFHTLLKSEERIRIRKEQMQQAKGKLALAQVKFNHDMADNFDVIEAQTELQSARTNILAARIEHVVGRYHLRAAMGTLLRNRENDSYNEP